MSILSWNCQGAGSTETVRYIREIRRKYFPDFMFFMETKQKFTYMQKLQESLGYDHIVTVESNGLSGGLTVMWKKCFEVTVLTQNKRIIDLHVKLGSLSFYVSCVYGDPIRERRQRVWEQITQIGLMRNEAWMLIGDFNELLDNDEKLGGAVRHASTFWNFKSLVENCKLKGIRYIGNCLSWTGWRDSLWVQCRLDRCFGNDGWFKLFSRAQSTYMDMWASDHRPLLLNFTKEAETLSRGRFYFDKKMFGHPGVEEAVKEGWGSDDESTQLTVMDRIGNCRKVLARFKRSSQLNSRVRIYRLQSDLEKEIAKRFPNDSEMKRIKAQHRTQRRRGILATEVYQRFSC